jgi:hypothetical protein
LTREFQGEILGEPRECIPQWVAECLLQLILEALVELSVRAKVMRPQCHAFANIWVNPMSDNR